MLALFGILFVIIAYPQDSVPEQKIRIDQSDTLHPWSHLNLNNDPENFQFAIVTDRTGGHRQGVFMDALKKLNLLQPEFVMSIGDLIEGYTRNETEIYRQWKEFIGFIDSLQMPFFYLPGNHDYINDVMARIWKELFGPSYYHFVYRNVLFLCLNSDEAAKGPNMGGIEESQFNYVKKVLEENQDVRWTLVFMHQPLWLFDSTGYWPDVEKLLEERKHTVFVGHQHHYVKYTRNNGTYIMLATTGGISRLRGPDFGEFDHVVWVTMTDEGPVIANLMLEGIWDENVFTEDLYSMMNADPIQIEPMFVEKDIFFGDDFEIKITNDDNYPMVAQLSFDINSELRPEVMEYQNQVPPNSVEFIKVRMNVAGPRWVSAIKPIKLYTRVTYLYEDEREIAVEEEYAIAPVKPAACNLSLQPVVIEGKLNDWVSLPHKGNSQSPITMNAAEYHGDNDANYEFNLKYDSSYLYFAMHVWDDDFVIDRQKSLWSQDVVRIFLDARPAIISANSKGNNRIEDFLYLHFTLQETKKEPPVIYQVERLPEGTRIATRKAGDGVDIEVAIPVNYLAEMNDASWENFRFNVAYFDYDSNSSTSAIWWRPDWESSENFIGSGMFVRGN